MLRAPHPICLKKQIEMNYMKNGPESQLWLFQFHPGYAFIKAWGGGGGGGNENIAF